MHQPDPTPSLESSYRDPTHNWSDLELDDMDMDCIDLSFMDGGNEDITRSAAAQPPPSIGSYSATGSPCVDADFVSTRESATDPRAQRSGQGDDQACVAIPLNEHDNVNGSCRENSDDHFREDGLAPDNAMGAQGVAQTFKSASIDGEMLAEGSSGKTFEVIINSSGRNNHKDREETLLRDIASGPLRSSASIDLSGMTTLEQSLSSFTASNATSSAITANAAWAAMDDGSSKGRLAKRDNEPDWVSEFDPEFVDMFRGYVTFI
ncbi:hypothetical protein VTH06DRAFT_4023 [Thermothelomyces fergusii]